MRGWREGERRDPSSNESMDEIRPRVLGVDGPCAGELGWEDTASYAGEGPHVATGGRSDASSVSSESRFVDDEMRDSAAREGAAWYGSEGCSSS
jgi:hypothetical protein